MHTKGQEKGKRGFRGWTWIGGYESAFMSSRGTFLGASIWESGLGRPRRTLFAVCEAGWGAAGVL